MTNAPILLITGITSGLGLAAARRIVDTSSTHIITGVRSQDARLTLRSVFPEDRCTILDLDLGALQSVRQFAGEVRDTLKEQRLSGMVLNAGVQITSGLETTSEGYEKTFAVNHLAHWIIHEELSPLLASDARIIFTASGTHDPDDPVAKRFGFRGGLFPSVEAVASGKLDPSVSDVQQCLDRYATSKLCNIMSMLWLAEHSEGRNYLAFDPGLMPGTHLARDRSALERFAWHNIMPIMGRFMKGVSSAKRSGRHLGDLATGKVTSRNTEYIEYTDRRLTPAPLARDRAKQASLAEFGSSVTALQ